MEEKKKEPEFRKSYPLDKKQLAEFINIAKGSTRTMAEFSEEIGMTSPSTFSRIINGNLKRPLSEDLMKAIYSNRAPDAKINYLDFMRSNGMVPLSKPSSSLRKKRKTMGNRGLFQSKLLVKNIIIDEYISRDVILLSSKNYNEVKCKYNIKLPVSFSVRVVPGAEDINEYEGFKPYADREVCKTNYNIIVEEQYVMQLTESLFLRDVWDSHSLEYMHNTIVLTDEEVFDEFIENLKDIKVNTWISVLLIDLTELRVEKEVFFERHDGRVMKSIFDLPVKHDRNDEDDNSDIIESLYEND